MSIDEHLQDLGQVLSPSEIYQVNIGARTDISEWEIPPGCSPGGWYVGGEVQPWGGRLPRGGGGTPWGAFYQVLVQDKSDINMIANKLMELKSKSTPQSKPSSVNSPFYSHTIYQFLHTTYIS